MDYSRDEIWLVETRAVFFEPRVENMPYNRNLKEEIVMKKYIVNAVIPVVVFCMTVYLWFGLGANFTRALDAGTTFGLIAAGLSLLDVIHKVTNK